MGWIEKRETRPAHEHTMPSSRQLDEERIAEGSVWKCPGCNAQWRFDGWRYGVASAQNDRDPVWTAVPTRRPEPVFGNFQGRSVDGGYTAAVRDDPSTQPGGGAVQQQWER